MSKLRPYAPALALAIFAIALAIGFLSEENVGSRVARSIGIAGLLLLAAAFVFGRRR
jgi:dolichyl-phosphate-mannose--protein O-mannosyl transferase